MFEFNYDLAATASVTYGGGTGLATSQHTYNGYSVSALSNLHRSSFGLSQTWNYDSAIGSTQGVGAFGFKVDGSTYFHMHNDVLSGSDRAWTAGAVLGRTNGRFSQELKYQDFTGAPSRETGPKDGSSRVNGYYLQTTYHENLNRSEWQYTYADANGSITVSITSGETLNGQHVVHDWITTKTPRFWYNEEQSVGDYHLSLELDTSFSVETPAAD